MNRSKAAYILLSIMMSSLLFGLLIQTTRSSEANYAATDETVSSSIYLPVVTNELAPIIPDTTEVLTEDTTQHLVAISADGSEFTFAQITPELSDLDPGDVMVSDVSAVAPYGFLRKVISVTSSNGQMIVTTGPATLEDAVEQGSFSVNDRFTPDDIQGGTALSGVHLVQPSETAVDDHFYIKLADVVLHDEDGNLDTKNDQIRANGSIELSPDFTLDLAVKNWELQYLRFTHQTVETANLNVFSNIKAPLIEKKKEIAHYPLGYITVPIGPVPVTIEFELSIVVGIDGSVHVNAATGVTQQMTITAGLEYDDDSWTPFSNRENAFQYHPPTLSAGLDIKAYAGAKLSTKLYGVAGPYAEVTPYLKLEADPFADPWWQLYGGLNVNAGVEIDVMSHVVAGYEATLIDHRWPLADANSHNPPHMPTDPSPVDGVTIYGPPILSWTGGDPDGDNVTYDVYLEANDSTPDVLVSNDQSGTTFDPGQLDAETLYYWQIVATDEEGEVTAGPVWDFAIHSQIVLILFPPEVDDLSVTVNGIVSATYSDISVLNWRWGDGDSGGQWFPAGHTYAVSGTYQISATAYDNIGNVVVETTTVEIGLPPILSRVSVSSDGTQGNNTSHSAAISGNGRYVTFISRADNLVVTDTNGLDDIFVHDSQTGLTTRASVASDDTQSNGVSVHPTISADGRYVAFASAADNLVAGDDNGVTDIFVHDRVLSQTYGISMDPGSTQLNGGANPVISADGHYVAYWKGTFPYYQVYLHDLQSHTTERIQDIDVMSWLSLSADGQYIAFDSRNDNLVPEDNNNEDDVFIYDRNIGVIDLVSVSSNGTQGNNNSTQGSISADGRYIAFRSYASNIGSGENQVIFDPDVFVHDRQTGTTICVSNSGGQSNGTSSYPAISADGRYVTFYSTADNLVLSDTNNVGDIFIHDLQSGKTSLISIASNGDQGNGTSEYPSISSDGQYIAFTSAADNFVPNDTGGIIDVFVHDR